MRPAPAAPARTARRLGVLALSAATLCSLAACDGGGEAPAPKTTTQVVSAPPSSSESPSSSSPASSTENAQASDATPYSKDSSGSDGSGSGSGGSGSGTGGGYGGTVQQDVPSPGGQGGQAGQNQEWSTQGPFSSQAECQRTHDAWPEKRTECVQGPSGYTFQGVRQASR